MTFAANMEKQPLLESRPNEDRSLTDPEENRSLSELQQDVFKAQRTYMKAWSRTTSGRRHQQFMYCVTALLVTFMGLAMVLIAMDAFDEDEGLYRSRIPLEAHIMSKCPDAKDCLHDMILPAMQKVGHKVDFTLSYIGSTTDHDDGVTCKHGQSECLGNIIELCAAKLYPDPKMYLGFTMCMTKDYENIPDRSLVEDCALEHGMSMEKINKCTTDDDGELSVGMLKDSFNRSSTAGVTKSCTVRLGGKVRCIRDGGKWTDCKGGSKAQDLVNDILDMSAMVEEG